MARKITVNHKEYVMPKMDADTYMDYLDLVEKIEENTNGRGRYTRTDIEVMTAFICRAYGGEFTAEELKDKENGVDAAGIIMEFMMIDTEIASEMEKRADEIIKNAKTGRMK